MVKSGEFAGEDMYHEALKLQRALDKGGMSVAKKHKLERDVVKLLCDAADYFLNEGRTSMRDGFLDEAGDYFHRVLECCDIVLMYRASSVRAASLYERAVGELYVIEKKGEMNVFTLSLFGFLGAAFFVFVLFGVAVQLYDVGSLSYSYAFSYAAVLFVLLGAFLYVRRRTKRRISKVVLD